MGRTADLRELISRLADGTLRVSIRARLAGLDAVPAALAGGALSRSASPSSASSGAVVAAIDASPPATGKTVVVLDDGIHSHVGSSAVHATLQPESFEMKR